MIYNIISGLLAVIFLISGLSKISGSNAGLSGTRDVGINDLLARLIGVVEAVAALGAEILQNSLVCNISQKKKIDERNKIPP